MQFTQQIQYYSVISTILFYYRIHLVREQLSKTWNRNNCTPSRGAEKILNNSVVRITYTNYYDIITTTLRW